jgi:hypothetical protein
MMGFPPNGGNARTQWSVCASKDVARSPAHVEGFVDDAATEALDMAVEHPEAGRWRAAVSRPFSLFDQCVVAIRVIGAGDGGATSTVEVDVTFDASSSRVGLTFGMMTSVALAPLAWGWRFQSVRSARAYAQKVIEALWRALDARTRTNAYR